MALILADRVRETTTTTGTGSVTLAGALTGFQTFSAAVGDGNTTYYVIAGQGTSAWEVGIGTYASAGNTLARTTVLSSSNGGSLVNFSAGTKDVWVDYAAGKAVTTDTLAYPPAIGGTTPAAGTFTTVAVTGGLQNLLLQSQTFNVSPWSPTQVTINQTATTAPDSTTTGNSITPTAVSSLHRFSQVASITSGITYTASVYAKANGYNYLYFNWDGAFNARTTFNISTGAISTTGSGTATITSAGNGWYRCTITGTASSSQSAVVGFLQVNSTQTLATDETFTGNGTSGIFLWGAQLETSPTVHAYQVTTTVAASANPVISLSGGGTVGLQSDGSIYQTSASTGSIKFYTNNTLEQLRVTNTASAVNYQTLTGSATTFAPVHSVAGSDANISLAIQSKGTTGAIDLSAQGGVNISNGGTVTALTRTANGSAYTSPPTIAISAPTTAGGVQATATSALALNAGTPTITSGGTGYSVGDVLTFVGGTFTQAVQLTVSTVSSGAITGVNISLNGIYTVLPSNPISTTVSPAGGTGATFTATTQWGLSGIFTITNAGSGYVEQPTVTFSGGGGSGAAAYATVGSQTIVKGLGTSIGTITNQSIMFQTPAGNSLLLRDPGQGPIDAHVMIVPTASGYAQVLAEGSNANASLYVGARGTGSVRFSTQSTSITEQMRVSNTTSAVNYIQVTGGATGAGPTISVQGSDGSAELIYRTKGIFNHSFQNGSSAANFIIDQTAGTAVVNRLQASGSLTGFAPKLASVGSDGNIALALLSKGTGAIDLAAGSSGVNISNGGTVTAITRTAGGGGYTSFPSIAISAPTTAGGVQATATVAQLGATAATIQSGGTGYTNGDVLTLVGGTSVAGAATFTVTGVSGGVITSVSSTNFLTYTVLPTNPVSVTGGTGSGATLNVTYYVQSVFNITNAGSGYVEQPTVTFSGGGGTSAAAYATVGSNPIVRTLGGSLSVYSPGGEQLRVGDTYTGGTSANYVYIRGRSAGAGPIISANGGDAAVSLNIAAAGTGSIGFQTANGGTQQFNISHTASAVNYVQVTGAATTLPVIISTQGSDASVGMYLRVKGNPFGPGFRVENNNGSNICFAVTTSGASVANYPRADPAAAGFGAGISAQGTDTDIPIVLQPKGTGALQAQQTDSTATGGNARGPNAVDWQTSRGAASQVASGQYAVLTGGVNNTVTSFGGVVGGGSTNQAATNIYTVVGGGLSNTTTGERSFVGGGSSNTAAGYLNFIGAGFTNSGTSGTAVTTQSSTMNGTTAVTLAATNANIKVGQYITGTSIATNTYVAAISGTSLTLSQAASGSSTSTLSFYTPHGVVVGGGNNQATGSYSFIGGGGDAGTAANRNVASGDWSFVGGGIKNTASGVGSVVVGGGWSGGGLVNPNLASNSSSFVGAGYTNTSSGVASVVTGGINNNANATGSSIIGGGNNVANSNYASVIGGNNATTRSIVGNTVFAASSVPISNSSAGISQSGLLILARQTTDATASILTSDQNTTASTTNQVILPNNSAYTFRGEIVAGVTGGGNSKSWTIEGLIKRGAGVGTTVLVGSTVTSMYADVGAATWTIALSADTTNGGLAVTFTGQAATTIRCVAQIRTTEMTY